MIAESLTTAKTGKWTAYCKKYFRYPLRAGAKKSGFNTTIESVE